MIATSDTHAVLGVVVVITTHADDVRDGRVSGTAATIEDGFTALDLVLAAEEAARSGCVVDVGAR